MKACTNTWYAAPVEGEPMPDHGVSVTGEPHRCARIDSQGEGPHSECVCECGSTAKRPVGELNVARHEARIGRASISVDEAGRGRVMVGLVDISDAVSGGTAKFHVGQPTVIKVEIPAAAFVARGEIELDDPTAGALLAIGWLSPDQAEERELLRRRDLAEALGTTGVVLPDWDTLISAVQVLAAMDEQREPRNEAP